MWPSTKWAIRFHFAQHHHNVHTTFLAMLCPDRVGLYDTILVEHMCRIIFHSFILYIVSSNILGITENIAFKTWSNYCTSTISAENGRIS